MIIKSECRRFLVVRPEMNMNEVGIAVATFLIEYVVAFVVSENLVEVDVASDTDDLAVFVVAAFAGVVFDYNYIVCVVVDVAAVAGYVVLFVFVAVGDAGVPCCCSC